MRRQSTGRETIFLATSQRLAVARRTILLLRRKIGVLPIV